MGSKRKQFNIGTVILRVGLVAGLVWMLTIIGLLGVIHATGTQDNAQEADAILVLGSGLSRNGRPGWALTRRSSHAAELWHAGYADTIVCTGGIADNQTRSEADGCREVLMRRGVPQSAILLEERSASTEENALFSETILVENNINSIILVTDSYHIFRAGYIFNRIDVDVVRSPVSSDLIRGYPTYEYSMLREIAALHWQIFKDVFNIPITNIS